MTASRKVTFYHSPNTRSTGARILLEELGADYDLHVLNIKTGEQRAPAAQPAFRTAKVVLSIRKKCFILDRPSLLKIQRLAVLLA